jgi:hypothetical protein
VDLTPELDTNLPGVDAAFEANPAPGQVLPPRGDAGTGEPSSGDDATESGTKPGLTQDSGALDATPPVSGAGATKPAPGEVLITEVMSDTTGAEPVSEWIEVHNMAAAPRLLSGLTLKDGGGRTHVIAAGVTVAPGAYLVLARDKAGAVAAKVPATAIAYEYGAGLSASAGVLLANGASGAVSLLDGSTVISSAPYGGWFTQPGSSAQLKVLDAAQSSSKASWCLSANAWTSGSEKGTPGAAEDCP